MLIQVSYDDNKFDYVKDYMLDQLIQSGAISSFKRRSGWVRVGIDPVRSQRCSPYFGEERRGAAAALGLFGIKAAVSPAPVRPLSD
ncbi:GSU3473 family protein [Geomonas agri]|uniref:GSU3473 family protein n=1 Tax=Geomonas agri TaxID=2873702 RepID=UPI001CD7FA8E|nr:hypothetical protein [Geomonas agri]